MLPNKACLDALVSQKWINIILEAHICGIDDAFLLVVHYKILMPCAFIVAVNDIGVDADYILARYTYALQQVEVAFHTSFKGHIPDCHKVVYFKM
jgi:hypothetical protein